MADWYAPT
uniref:Uncharacterized protein n=1 Tax=Arundo donax TaxID=35708 RepID=A0A0A9B8X7_ARUDO